MGHRHLLLTKDFGLMWLSQLFSQIGDGVSNLALLWFVYSATGSPVKTTVIGLLQTIPSIVLSPFIGVYVDRLPKKLLLLGSNTLRAMLLGFIPCIIPTETFTAYLLYFLVLLNAVAVAMFGPTLTSSVPLIVPRTQFTAANALIQSTTSLGMILGPAVSGIGIASSSSQEVLCLNAGTYVGSTLCLALVRLAPACPAGQQRPDDGSVLSDLREGITFITLQERVILLLIAAAGFYAFGTSALTALFPVFARKMLDAGPVEVGYLWSALGTGLLLMSMLLLWFTEWNLSDRPKIIAGASAASGLAIGAFIWTKDFYMASLLMMVIGGGMGAFTPIAWGIMQELTPRTMVGRVLGLYSVCAMTAALIGISTLGWVTERFGEPAAITAIGVVLCLTACTGAWLSWSMQNR